MSIMKHLGRRRGQERVVFETELEPLNVIFVDHTRMLRQV